MIRGLTRTGLETAGSDENLIALAAAYSFAAVDLDPQGLVERNGLPGTRELLSRYSIRLGSILLPVEWRKTEEQFRKDLVPLAARLETAAALGANSFWTYLLPSVDELPGPFMATATRRLRICAQFIEAFGLSFALEFLGPHDLRTRWKHPFVWNIDQTLEWIGAIDRPNVGLLVDSFHWHTAGHSVADLTRLTASQVTHVHLNDAPATPIDRLPDNDRVYPGEGAIDLPGFLGALKTIGYRGIVAQEVLTPSPPVAPAEALMARSKKGYDTLFTRLGLD